MHTHLVRILLFVLACLLGTVEVYGGEVSPDPEGTINIKNTEQKAAARSSMSDKFRVLEQELITDEKSGYTGWPTIAVLPSKELFVVASGGRIGHSCPFGKTYLYKSSDLGHTWQGPILLWDGVLDDRGAGILVTSKGTVLVDWFTSIAWFYWLGPTVKSADAEKIREYGNTVTLEDFKREIGYWMMRSEDGGKTWSEIYRVPVNAPHGACELNDSTLLYVGYAESSSPSTISGGGASAGDLVAAQSKDDGKTWKLISNIPVLSDDKNYQNHEPHVVQANDGTIIVHIRKSYPKTELTMQWTSKDGGLSWSEPQKIYWGYPSHLLRLKDGRILVTYGYRKSPMGIRARISLDSGKSWSDELVLYDKAVSGDMGYPSTVELPDGKLYTVWYEKTFSPARCAINSLRWELTKQNN